MRWADFHFDCVHIDTANTSDTVVDDLGPFKVKSHTHAPVSEDIALETFLATVENKLFDADKASHESNSNISKAENKALCQLRSSKDFVVRLQDKGSRFVILDKNDYIDKVEHNLNDVSLIFWVQIRRCHTVILSKIEEVNGWKKVILPSLLLTVFLMSIRGKERTVV